MKIAVVGDIGVDYYQNLDVLKPGGISFNVAYHLNDLGAGDVSLVSVLGNDSDSQKLFVVLKKLGINQSHVQKKVGLPPKQNILLKNGERKFIGYEPGVLKKWKLRKKDLDFIKQHEAVFVPLSDGMEHIFNAVKKINDPVKVVDFSQDYELADFDQNENIITKNAKFFDIIFIGGEKKHQEMIELLAKKYPQKVFVLTLGKNGSIAYYQGSKTSQAASTIKKVVDTTGCGDAFQAGFLYSWLINKNAKSALQLGTNRASQIINTVGSTPIFLNK